MNDFNQLAFNGKAFPATTPLVAQTGERDFEEAFVKLAFAEEIAAS